MLTYGSTMYNRGHKPPDTLGKIAYIQLCISTWFSAILASSVRKAPSLFITTESVLLFVAHYNILWTAQSRITSHPGE